MISIVVPVFNEEESLKLFYSDVIETVKDLDKSYEILFIDDGSTDSSLMILQVLARQDKHVRIFSFRKNQGKAEALTLGFQKARGDYIVTLDADLQDPPSEIPRLIKKLHEGFDCASGWRKERKDKDRIRIISIIFNMSVKIFWGLSLHDYNCGLKAYKREVAKSLALYGGMHRFIPLLLVQQGFTVTEISTQHRPRSFGKSKYGFAKVFKDLPDMFTILFLSRYSQRPMHFFGLVGGGMLGIGLITLSYLTVIWFMGESIGRRPLLFLGILLVMAGLQIFFTGFLADFILSLSRRNAAGSYDSLRLLKYTTD